MFEEAADEKFERVSDVEEEQILERLCIEVDACSSPVDDVLSSRSSNAVQHLVISSRLERHPEDPTIDPFCLQTMDAVIDGVLVDFGAFSSKLSTVLRLSYLFLLAITGPAGLDGRNCGITPAMSVEQQYQLASRLNEQRNCMSVPNPHRLIFKSFISYLIDQHSPAAGSPRLSTRKTLKTILNKFEPKAGVDRCFEALLGLQRHFCPRRLNRLLSGSSGLKEELLSFLSCVLPTRKKLLWKAVITRIDSRRLCGIQGPFPFFWEAHEHLTSRTASVCLHPQLEIARSALLSSIAS